jgi:hypothetical protein
MGPVGIFNVVCVGTLSFVLVGTGIEAHVVLPQLDLAFSATCTVFGK